MLRLAFDFIIAWRENTHEAECLLLYYGKLLNHVCG